MSDLQLQPQPPLEGQINGPGSGSGAQVGVPIDTAIGPPKRHRRPSVRLGDIGDQHTYNNQRRSKQHQWKFSSKASKTRPLVNLTTDYQETLDVGEGKDFGNINQDNNMNNGSHGNGNGNGNGNSTSNNALDSVAIGSWKARVCSKSKRGFSTSKRVRSNWVSKLDEGEDEGDYDDQSLNFSMDNERDLDLDYVGGDGARVRVSDGVEFDEPCDTDARNWNHDNLERDGVRVWLNQLGLGRYAPVFEVHEVDDEVLPLLTLEDLKDMGINAVGSRRKMFCSIQKLGKGFS